MSSMSSDGVSTSSFRLGALKSKSDPRNSSNDFNTKGEPEEEDDDEEDEEDEEDEDEEERNALLCEDILVDELIDAVNLGSNE